MTLNQIASNIELNMINGLKGTNNNASYNLEQIKDDIKLNIHVIHKQLIDKGLLRLSDIVQSINCLELECKDIAECCDIDSGETALHFKIPKLASVFDSKAVLYVGLVNKNKPFKVLFGNQHIYNKYSVTKHEPYVWFSDLENGWLFNPPTNSIKLISIKAVFADPFAITQYSCCEAVDEDAPYPANPEVISTVIDLLSKKYINYYRQMNMIYIPNNGQSVV